MESPECPVCLQSYDAATVTIPRVLPCGHSACELCLSLLPSPSAHPNALRCPACTQLVRFPNPSLGAKSLPKNIDLLRFCCSSPSPSPVPGSDTRNGSRPKPEPDTEFPPRPWTEELVRVWTPWILPSDSISLMDRSVDQVLVLGTHRSLSGGKNQQSVSLFPIGISCNEPKWFRLSYVAQVMESVCRLGERGRPQLLSILDVCSRQRSGICRVLGLWMNPDEETSPLFLVCEKFDQDLSGILKPEGKWRLGLDTVEKFGFGMLMMELCEVVMSFHSKGAVFGCLGMDCFSFDMYGHCLLDLNSVLVKSKRLCEVIEDEKANSNKTLEFLSPEVFAALHEGSLPVNHGSDIWSLGCMLALILGGDAAFELFDDFNCQILKGGPGNFGDACLSRYEVWKEKVISKLEALLMGTKFDPLLQILSSCLMYHSESRPQVKDIWCCIRNCFIEIPADSLATFDSIEETESKENLISCLFIGNMGSVPKEAGGVSRQQGNIILPENAADIGLDESSGTNTDLLQQEQVNGDSSKGLKFDTLQGHHDCISGLAVAGGYLFSSSFDKTVGVWFLQDFSHIRVLQGHEHRVMAMAVVDEIQPLCISGDSGSGIFVWRIGTSPGQELIQKWYEHNDWRYSGIHSLAVSGGYLYSGSGDKSIKAWSLQDYSLACTMTGHNSTVSSLAVANGVLYSGSWDGTIRLWCLSDHSLLLVLGMDTMAAPVPILSLSVDGLFLVSGYEDGSIKIWKNDTIVRSVQIQDGPILAVHLDAKWLFSGGWSKYVNIQELLEDELQITTRPLASIMCDSAITSLFYSCGKLFVGLSNKEIKVYYCGIK